MLNQPFPRQPCRPATETGRRTSPPKPASRPARRRARQMGPRGSRHGALEECAPGVQEKMTILLEIIAWRQRQGKYTKWVHQQGRVSGRSTSQETAERLSILFE